MRMSEGDEADHSGSFPSWDANNKPSCSVVRISYFPAEQDDVKKDILNRTG